MKIIKTLASVAVLTVASNSAWAAGTTAGTGVDNTASISYSVGGTPQTEIESSEAGNTTPGAGNGTSTSFIVDKKVDVDVTAGAASQNIVPNGTASHTFTVTNEGNDIEYFSLDDVDATSGDVFDTTGCTITVDSVTGALPAIPASDTVTASPSVPSTASPLRLGPDGTATVTMECTAPNDVGGTPLANGDDADVSLLATAVTTAGGTTALTATTGADKAGAKDTVLADAAGSATGDVVEDASHSATVANVINTAELTVRKESAVISDPINGVSPNAKRIPDALIRYTITVSNQAAEADHIVISDIVPSDLTYVTCAISGDGVVNAAAPDAGVALACSESGGTVSSTSFTLPAGTVGTPTTAVLTIDATIN